MRYARCSLVLVLLLLSAALGAQPNSGSPLDSAALSRSVEELRSSVGLWDVETRFLGDDGSVSRTVKGTYEFAWVVPDRVVSGRTEIPELSQIAGILFYINVAKREIEMVSVASDGVLWTMTGPLGGEVRTSQPFATSTGGRARLRFTRSAVTADTFESRMEYSVDDSAIWLPGNHQLFSRRPPPPSTGVSPRR